MFHVSSSERGKRQVEGGPIHSQGWETDVGTMQQVTSFLSKTNKGVKILSPR